MTALNLTYEYFVDPHVEEKYDCKIFLILRSFLQPSKTKSVKETVESIIELLPKDAFNSNEIHAVSSVITDLAEQIPYHHPSHVKFARVVAQLCRLDQSIKAYDKERYGCFGNLYESLNEGYGHADQPNPTGWVNFSAFLANVAEVHIWPTSPEWAIRAVTDAFEIDTTKEVDWFKGIKNYEVLAAAQHILWNGQSLLKQILYLSDETLGETSLLKPGPLHDGHFWENGFRDSAKDFKIFSDECRNVAAKAAGLMDSLGHSLMDLIVEHNSTGWASLFEHEI